MDGTLRMTFDINGVTFTGTQAVEGDGQITREVSLAAAKTGTLSTRTDDDTGELTMTAGHGITTGQRLDVYWDGGCRYGMTVGTVATNQVPIDGGTGDVLPVATTAITAMVPREELFDCAGDDIKMLAASGAAKFVCVLFEEGAPDVEHLAYRMNAAGVRGWSSSLPDTNPVAGDTIDKVYLSHGDSSAARVVKVSALLA